MKPTYCALKFLIILGTGFTMFRSTQPDEILIHSVVIMYAAVFMVFAFGKSYFYPRSFHVISERTVLFRCRNTFDTNFLMLDFVIRSVHGKELHHNLWLHDAVPGAHESSRGKN